MLEVFKVLSSNSDWHTVIDIGDKTGLPNRTVAYNLRRLVQFDIVEQTQVLRAFRYRLSPQATKRNPEMLERLKEGEKVLKDSVTRSRPW